MVVNIDRHKVTLFVVYSSTMLWRVFEEKDI